MNIIPLLESQVIRAALVALVGLIGLIASYFGVNEEVFGEKASKLVDALLLVITTGSTLWAAYARATKPTPPLTEGAAAATAARIEAEKQGGFARVGLVGVLAVLAGCAALGLPPVAKTLNERLASGYTTVTAVREATSAFIDAKVRQAQAEPDAEKRTAILSAARADAENVQAQADKAREGLDVARSLAGIDLKSAEARLASTLIILQTLQEYLEGK